MLDPIHTRITNLLRLNEECSGLNGSEFEAFLPISRFETYHPGEIVFSESQPANSFFILETGHVRMNFSRREPLDLNPGQMFGDWAIINNTVRLATAVARTKSTVLEIDATRFFEHDHVHPAVSLHVVKTIARKLIVRLQSRNQVSTRILIEYGENEQVEFKSTLRKNLKTNAKDPAIELAVLKTVAAFLNNKGGTLLVGIQDNGDILGVEPDEFANPDKYLLHFSHLLENRMGTFVSQYIHYDLVKLGESFILRVDCDPSSKPVFVKDGSMEYFFVRSGPSTLSYNISQAIAYIQERF
ncbi:MAG: putative DNA binding domain-containing protein [Saprospiraceae bacterium]|nr:putative DNA binding domain-containing protein [Saprospiraceae bacterium]